jgi:hypothetical protein
MERDSRVRGSPRLGGEPNGREEESLATAQDKDRWEYPRPAAMTPYARSIRPRSAQLLALLAAVPSS